MVAMDSRSELTNIGWHRLFHCVQQTNACPVYQYESNDVSELLGVYDSNIIDQSSIQLKIKWLMWVN